MLALSVTGLHLRRLLLRRIRSRDHLVAPLHSSGLVGCCCEFDGADVVVGSGGFRVAPVGACEAADDGDRVAVCESRAASAVAEERRDTLAGDAEELGDLIHWHALAVQHARFRPPHARAVVVQNLGALAQ